MFGCRAAGIRLILVIPLVLVLSATLLAADNYRDDQGNVKTGKLSLRQEQVGRNYYMYVPTGYTPQKRWPLIISAPGTFPFDSSPGTRDSWVKAAEESGLIILCPDFDSANGLLNVKNDRGKLERDDAAAMAIISEVRSRYSIDPNGIAITGWSGGGYPAHYIGLKHPDIFRAIIGRTANFSEDLVDDETARRARHMHVYCFFAKSDLAGIPEQNRRANYYYTTRHFLNFEIEEIEGGHSKNNELAAAWFLKLLRTKPVVRIQASPLEGRAPLTVNLKALASDPDGRIATYIWNFGDKDVSIHPAVQHTFKAPGKYNVFLTVVDNDGNREYAQVTVEVK